MADLRKRLYVAAALAGAVLAAGPAMASGPPDPLRLYGPEMVFSVWRSGSKIGEHRVIFAREDGALVVRSYLDLAVKFLGITLYRYAYRAQEVWRDGVLAQLTSAVDDNGTAASVKAHRAQGKLDVTGSGGKFVAPGTILPSTNWDAQVIGANLVLNTLDGKLDHVRLVPEGVTAVDTNVGKRTATHYLWTGDIKAEAWYDEAGHWLRLRFLGKDGAPIEYRCMRCVAPGG